MTSTPRIALITAFAALTACASGQEGLDALHADIVADYPSVSHVNAEALPNGDVLFLDIRDPEEYAVSHIPGAIRVSFGASPDEVMAAVGDVSGKEIVAYCSVGRRSSIFAKDMQDTLKASGAVSVANLEGGVFGWHADHRALEDARGATDLVHPYDEIWKRYVPRQGAVSYSAKAE